jgi:two-component system LytT family sensor kinase
MATPATAAIADVLGFLVGAALYVMLVVMVWRERAAEATPFLDRRGRLPLLTGLCGLVWNLGALASFGTQVTGRGEPLPAVVAIAFSALGFLPAVVVHSLVEGRETAAGRRVTRLTIGVAYGLSAAAALMHMATALDGATTPSRAALWLLTSGFTALTLGLLLLTRHQPIGRRGIWVVALAVFAVSALHFGRHVVGESWWIDLVGHHASLPLALAILHQDYRFALADLFLKNAIALLLLMGVSLAVFTAAMHSLEPAIAWDPEAIAVFIGLWMATVLLFPWLQRGAAKVVDRVVLRRPDYDVTLATLARGLESAQSAQAVAGQVAQAVQAALGAAEAREIEDPVPADYQPVVVSGSDLRAWLVDSRWTLLLRLRTAEAPYPAVLVGPLPAGRRLLSDDRRLLEAAAGLAGRRIDSLRVAQERVARDIREQQMQRLATEAELRALRAQLNPHFLFNALTTIGYLIQEAPPRALATLLRLTSVLRGVLRRSSAEFSTLDEEIELVASYLDIERARFEERLRISVEIAPDVRDALIPTLLLQPLVENAVRHGIAPVRAGGRVRVAAEKRGEELRILVEDTGVGFDPAAPAAAGGLGLRSVADRLRAHYAGAAALHIRSRVGSGTTVEIVMPAVVQPVTRRKAG